MTLRERFYPEVRFGGFTDADEFVKFYTRVHALLEPGFTALDIGCGRGAHSEDPVKLRRDLETLRGKCRRVIGIDVAGASRDNPLIDEFRQITADRWPVDDAEIDLAISDSVLEHVPNPDDFFAECRRVIRPGGYLCLKTPNVLSYFGLAARLVPNRHHAATVQFAQENRKAEDVFPTYYRCNTVGAVKRALTRHGFVAHVSGHEPEPNYLAFNRLLYGFGVLHQRLAPRRLQNVVLAFAQKAPAA
jgi:SAM-dependent methyltransferase